MTSQQLMEYMEPNDSFLLAESSRIEDEIFEAMQYMQSFLDKVKFRNNLQDRWF